MKTFTVTLTRSKREEFVTPIKAETEEDAKRQAWRRVSRDAELWDAVSEEETAKAEEQCVKVLMRADGSLLGPVQGERVYIFLCTAAEFDALLKIRAGSGDSVPTVIPDAWERSMQITLPSLEGDE